MKLLKAAAVVLALTLIVGCGKRPDRVTAWLTELGSPSPGIRAYAAGRLGTSKDKRAVEPLLNALGDKDASVRREAADALGKLGDRRATKPLIAALQDRDKWVRSSAVRSLGLLRDPAAVGILIAVIPRFGDDAVRSLGQIGDPRAIQPIIALLRTPNAYAYGAAQALGRFGKPAIAPLIKALKDANPSVREYAAEALGDTRDPRATDALIAALSDGNKDVRGRAAVSLGRPGNAPAVQPLIRVLQNLREDPNTRGLSAMSLGTIGDHRAFEPLIAELSSPSKGLRVYAVEALGKLKDPRAAKPVFRAIVMSQERPPEYWEGDDEFYVGTKALPAFGQASLRVLTSALRNGRPIERKLAAQLLCCFKDKRAIQALRGALRDTNEEVRLTAVSSLANTNSPEAVAPLIGALRDRSPKVSNAAADAFRACYPNVFLKDVRAVEPLVKLTKSQDAATRLSAAQALVNLAPERAVDPLVDILATRNSERDKAMFALAGALQNLTGHRRDAALAKIKQRISVESLIAALKGGASEGNERGESIGAAAGILGAIRDRRAVQPLIALLKDKDPEVQWSAADVLGQIGDPRALPVLTREFALDAVVDIEGKKAVPLLISTLQNTKADFTARMDAARLLGHSRDPRAVAPLCRALRDKDDAIRSQVAPALGEIRDASAVGPLIDALDDDAGGVRQNAADALGQIEDPKAERALVQALDRWDSCITCGAAEFYIRKGITDAVPVLLDALQDGGDADLAASLLYSGRPELVRAARKWARANPEDKIGGRKETSNGERYYKWGEGKRKP